MSFISYLVTGISLGSVYAIIALGYTMVYGIAKMLNFAHGDVIMIGGYVVFVSVSNLGINPYVAILISMAVCTVLGVVVEKVAYKPLRNASPLAVLITAIGVSYLLQNVALLIFGSDTKAFTSVVTMKNITLFDGQLIIPGVAVVTVLACIVIMIGLSLFIKKTKAGRAMVAVSEDKGAAQLMGINVNGTISLTFAIGSGLAAVASMMYTTSYVSIKNELGITLGLKAFVAAVLGGIGSVPGAMIGGLLLGIIEIMVKVYMLPGTYEAVTYLILIVVLLVRPTGLMGKKVSEKV